MKALETKKLQTIELLEEVKPAPIGNNDPFFSSLPVDIGLTSNVLIDKLLYGIECQE